MGCCYSNEEYETSHYGYKNLTNEIMNQKNINQSKNEINTARLFMITPLKPKNANSFKKNTEKKDFDLKPTIYCIQLKTNLSKAAKYSNNVNQSSFIEEENICNCSCANCKKNQTQTTERKSSRTPSQVTQIKSSRTASQIKDLNTTRSNQVFIKKDYKQPTKTNIPLDLKSKFNIEALDQHNKYRKSHGVPPLELNEYLIKLAQNHSDYLALTYRNVYLKHKYHGHDIGQNIKIYADSKLDSYSGNVISLNNIFDMFYLMRFSINR
jgi:uncharacterized protein YkwD